MTGFADIMSKIDGEPAAAQDPVQQATEGAAQVAAPVEEPAAAPPDNPPAEPVVPAFDETSYLSEITGGTVKSRDEIAAILEKAGAAEKYEQELKSVYPNEFVKGLAEMLKSGADKEQLRLYIDLSMEEDISKMDEMDALIKATYLKERDYMSMEDAKLLIESKYPKSAEDLADEKGLSMEDAEKQFRLLQIQQKKEIAEAKNFIQGFRKQVYENVVTGGRNVQLEQTQQAWAVAAPAIAKVAASESVKLEIKDESAGIDTAFELKLPKEFLDEAMKAVPQWAANAGLEVNDKNAAFIKAEITKAYIANNYQAVMESVIRDTWSKATKKAVEEVSNPKSPKSPSGSAQPLPAKGGFVDYLYGG